MLGIDAEIEGGRLERGIARLWELSAAKIRSIENSTDPSAGAPVFTVGGRYTSRGWTEWTQGFQYGSAILQYDATGDPEFLELGRRMTLEKMAGHVTHAGVHDHGFNNISTYGNLLRLMDEGRIAANLWEREFYRLALKCSGATQARRWTDLGDGLGYIYSFNGPHSLFVDTIRTLRVLAVAHQLGHVLMEEGDRVVSLLERLVQHARTTARYAIFYGEGRDAYDRRGRVAHEIIFNIRNGSYRCPATQQGFSPFSTWTRGLAWAICGFSELLEFLDLLDDAELAPLGGRDEISGFMRQAARAACDFYIENVPTDGIPYWDTGAPKLCPDGSDLLRPSDPFNDREPVDSSAAAIAAQGFLRLGRWLRPRNPVDGARYWQSGLTIFRTLLDEPYLSTDERHQGLILHSVYHRPNGWDHIPAGGRIPCGESTLWGDYHARELALYVQRVNRQEPYLTFALGKQEARDIRWTG
jgi:hypothetical protein